jgi:hypothetical protein
MAQSVNPLKHELFLTFKNSVPISKDTQLISITRVSRLMLSGEIVAVILKIIENSYIQNAKALNV